MSPFQPFQAIGEALVALLLLPFTVLAALLRLRRRLNAVPLPQRNMTRATGSAFALAGCAVLAAHGFPVVGSELTAGIAALALLYLVVGIHGSWGARIDLISALYWAVLALGGGALLVFIKQGFPL